MRHSNTDARRISLIVAVCAMLVSGAWAAAPSASSNRELTIANVGVEGQQVRVTVVNSGTATHTVSLSIRVTLEDGTVTAAAATAVVFGKQKAFVVLPMPSSIKDALIAGMIVDDPSPF
jgi:hypothetical protein